MEIQRNKLTGIKDVDFMILNELSDRDLKAVCQVNKYVNKLCNDENFWMKRLLSIFPISLEKAIQMRNKLEFDKEVQPWKNFYEWLMEEYSDSYETMLELYGEDVESLELELEEYTKVKDIYIDLQQFKDLLLATEIDYNFDVLYNSTDIKLPKFVNREIFFKEFKRQFYRIWEPKFTQTTILNFVLDELENQNKIDKVHKQIRKIFIKANKSL